MRSGKKHVQASKNWFSFTLDRIKKRHNCFNAETSQEKPITFQHSSSSVNRSIQPIPVLQAN